MFQLSSPQAMPATWFPRQTWFNRIARSGSCILFRVLSTAIALSSFSSSMMGQTNKSTESDKLVFFEKHVRPALTKYCYECHANDTESNGGLNLDSKMGWEEGGDSGPALVPGRPDESRLMKAIRYEDAKMQMPPNEKLPLEIIKIFETWVHDGAFDPRDDENQIASGSKSKSLEEARAYWSYQPLQTPAVPKAAVTTRTGPIDCFVDQKLAQANLVAAPRSGKMEQVRRLHLDLTGLPPSVETVRRLEQANDFDAAYENLVDSLLSTPQYGEAFARRWMDVARYGESVTLRGLVFKQAWRYRDYLIQAFSDDRPFDQMIREQIAGDLLPTEESTEQWKQLVATSFLAMGDTNFEKQDKEQLDMDYVDEQLDVIGQAFLGQTIGCARCHDHKFDPIPTKDYYALAGILKSAVSMRHSNVSNWIEQPLPLPPNQEQQFAKLESELEQATKDMATKKKLAAALAKKETQKKSTSSSASPTTGPGISEEKAAKPESDSKVVAEEIKMLTSQMKQLQEGVDQRPKYLTVVEESAPVDLPIHIRGDVHNLGAVAPRGFLTAIQLNQPMQIPAGASGRLELARWLSSEENPLTARVYANRVWTWLMGQGLVESVNNFGTTGTTPSHPELLDWLASELIRSNWSTKHLVRLIVQSESYRRKIADPDARSLEVDPDNRLYWRGHYRRLSVEELRDSMLQASGELNTAVGGSLIQSSITSDYKYRTESTRRSLYHPVFRNSLPKLFEAFDFAQSSMSIGMRSRSTVSTQALALMNESWVHERAKAMAIRIHNGVGSDNPSAWIRSAYESCFQREPSSQEFEVCIEFFATPGTENPLVRLERLAHSLMASIDFRYLSDH